MRGLVDSDVGAGGRIPGGNMNERNKANVHYCTITDSDFAQVWALRHTCWATFMTMDEPLEQLQEGLRKSQRVTGSERTCSGTGLPENTSPPLQILHRIEFPVRDSGETSFPLIVGARFDDMTLKTN